MAKGKKGARTSGASAVKSRATVSRSSGVARERQNIGRSVFATARARDLLAEVAPDVVRPSRRVAVRQADPVAPSRRPPAAVATVATDRRTQDAPRKAPLKVEAIKPDACKARPDSSRGNGGSRSFVPWCSKR